MSSTSTRHLRVRTTLARLAGVATVLSVILLVATNSAEATSTAPTDPATPVLSPLSIGTATDSTPDIWNAAACSVSTGGLSMIDGFPSSPLPPIKLCVWCTQPWWAPGPVCITYWSFWGCGSVAG